MQYFADGVIQPNQVVCGLGALDRELAATLLAVFDECSLNGYLQRVYLRSKDWLRGLSHDQLEAMTAEIEDRRQALLTSALDVAQLRLILWIRIRRALLLPPLLAASDRGAGMLADDVAARVVSLLAPLPGRLDPPKQWLRRHGLLRATATPPPQVTLQSVVEPVLRELLSSAAAEPGGAELQRAIDVMNGFSADSRAELRQNLGVDRMSAAAVGKTAATGGGLAFFSSVFGLSGTTAAAQFSAFIPMLSSSGLLSFVAVLANPITALMGTVGIGWWLGTSAQQRIEATVATRMVALLAIQGLAVGKSGIAGALDAFTRAGSPLQSDALTSSDLAGYAAEYHMQADEFAALSTRSGTDWRAFEQPFHADARVAAAASETGSESYWEGWANPEKMTVGDVLYHAAQMHPNGEQGVERLDDAGLMDASGGLDAARLAEQLVQTESVLAGLTGPEQLAALILRAQGAAVSRPDLRQHKGQGLMVDGQRVQVCFATEVADLLERARTHGDPILTNTELMKQIPEHLVSRIHFIGELDMAVVANLSEVDPNVEMPSARRVVLDDVIDAFERWLRRRKNAQTAGQAIEQILVDGVDRARPANTRNIAGASVGFFLFGPAGAWALGAGLPMLAQRQSGRLRKLSLEYASGPQRRRWVARGHTLLDELQNAGCRALQRRMDHLVRLCQSPGSSNVQRYLAERAGDDASYARACLNQCTRLSRVAKVIPEQRLALTLKWLAASEIHPLAFQQELDIVSAHMNRRPRVVDELR